MRLGIIGLPQSGKKTLFSLLAGEAGSGRAIDPTKTHVAVMEIADPRLDRLVDLYHPRKTTPARLELVLLPRLEKRSFSRPEILKEMDRLEALVLVVRCFRDERVYHVEGSVDPRRDVDYVFSELILHDLLIAERRLETLRKNLRKTKDERGGRLAELLAKMKGHLEEEKPLRRLSLTPEEERMIAGHCWLTRKGIVVVFNVGEDDLRDARGCGELTSWCQERGAKSMVVAAALEEEIAVLAAEEREVFLREMGIGEPSLSRLIRVCLDELGLISFFTVRNREVRQWLLSKGSKVSAAAGKIHTDMKRGFIRAEVISFSNIDRLGSEDRAREEGKIKLVGKDYVVGDGDILSIRFSV